MKTLKPLFHAFVMNPTEPTMIKPQSPPPPIESAFVTVWEIVNVNETIIIPAIPYVVNNGHEDNGIFDGYISWFDSSGNLISTDTFDSYDSPSFTHEFPIVGEYTCKITGKFPFIRAGYGVTGKLISVENLGEVGWVSFYESFYGAVNLKSFTVGNMSINDTGEYALTSILVNCTSLTTVDLNYSLIPPSLTDMDSLFWNCTSLTGVIEPEMFWENQQIETWSGVFYNCTALENYGDILPTSWINP